MKEKLLSLISDLRANRKIASFDEAATKQAVVLRLLAILGWDHFNVDEVKPEHVVGTKKVDYALRVSNTNKVFIEVKRINELLENHQEQLLSYSFQEGVKLAILTNGITWWFYLPLTEGSWEQRRFYTVDLLQQEPQDICTKFIEFLSKEYILSVKTIEIAERLYKSQQKKKTLESTIPKAWNKIVSDPDELLIEVIVETTEKLSGFRPQTDAVEKFLAKHTNQFQIVGQERPSTDYKPITIPSRQRSPSKTVSYLGKSIKSFTFRGVRHQVRTWKELLTSLTQIIYDKHTSEFDKAFSFRGPKRVYFSRTPNEMREPLKVGRTNIYVETHWSANSTLRICLGLLALFGYSDQDLKIEIIEK